MPPIKFKILATKLMRQIVDRKMQAVIRPFFALLGLIMIFDYCIGGKIYVEEVISINKSLQNYYNAGGNSHYSFHIETRNYNIPVTEDFASIAEEGQEMKIEISTFFSEVNSSELVKTGDKEVYSFRLFSGLLLPIFAVSILIFKHKKEGSVLLLVIQVVILFNLVYLLS